ncbi:MAG: SRPBCC family protein, partial [Actinomycetes bacterium]
VVADLGTYADWLDIVRSVEPLPAAPDDAGPAWSVVLQGQLGPLRRSKRLRMVRTVQGDDGTVRFERSETDGRSHSAWVLSAEVRPSAGAAPDGSQLVMRLHYGGSMWMPLLDRLLADEIERSRPRLVEVVGGAAT